MRYLWAAVLALTLAGCASNRTGNLVPAWEELMVIRADGCSERFYHCALWHPYLHPTDIPGPVWFLIAMDGRGCEVSGNVANRNWMHGDRWACDWRFPRR